MSELTLNEYQSRTGETAVYPESGTGSIIAVNYAALGVANEGGEVAGKIKKAWRDDNGVITEAKRTELLGELGDVLWYVSQVATEIGWDLSEIAQSNLAKLSSRKERGVIGGSGDNR